MLRIFSNGGGVQSTAALILSAKAQQAAAGDPDAAAFLLAATHHRFDLNTIIATAWYPIHAFSNVGADSENPDTLRYVDAVILPYAQRTGITFAITERRRRDGSVETLYGQLMKEGSRSLPIPIRMSNGAPGRRSCTADFKIKVLSKFARSLGATKQRPAITGLGISLDEYERMRTESGEAVQQLAYPLIDLRLTRDQCESIIEREGLPVPPKSSCYFCPFHRPSTWMRMRVEQPELFTAAAHLEDTLNARRAALGKDSVWLTRFAIPLEQAIGEQSVMDFESDSCEAGYCMT